MDLIGKKVVIRAVEEKDLELLKTMINDPNIEKLVGGKSFPVSTYMQKKWFENIQNDSKNIYLVIDIKHGETIGMVSITDIDWKNRVGYIGIKIGNEINRGKGFGRDAIMTIMRYIFEELNFQRLETCILEYNKGSQKLFLQKCGWMKEGIRRQCFYNSGKYHNVFILGILQDEYFKLVDENRYWKF